MRRRTGTIALAAATAAAGATLILWARLHNAPLREPPNAPPESPPLPILPAPVTNPPAPSRIENPPLHVPAPTVSRANARPAAQPRPREERDTIPNERVLSFYSESDREAFAALADRLGAAVLGRSRPGWLLRIRTATPEQLQRLLEQGPLPVKSGPNVHVRVPQPPFAGDTALPPQEPYTSFGAAGADWLGARRGRAQWGQGVTVAILDTGVGVHPALEGVPVRRIDMLDSNGAGGSAAGIHGTAVASIVAGRSALVPGVAPAAELLSVRVMSDEGRGDAFTVASGIVEAADRGARVINLCLGTYGDCFALRDAVAYAIERDAVVIAAVGNDATGTLLYPAAYDGVVAVTGVDAQGRHLYFANRGDAVDVATPGIGVNAAAPGDRLVLFSGTSAAAPFVSGAVAAWLSANPTLGPAEAAAVLLRSCDDLGLPGPDPEYGRGVLNLKRLMEWNVPDVYDAAVGIASGPSGRIMAHAQNRGTSVLPRLMLSVDVDGARETIPFYDVQVGQTVSHTVTIELTPGVPRSATVRASADLAGLRDASPADNAAVATVRFTPGAARP